ncbi:MAG: AhpC/TSA family protein [Bacteroidales bacterium]|nr:AhpC/TSA family protein [Bacteroidales bacterium]
MKIKNLLIFLIVITVSCTSNKNKFELIGNIEKMNNEKAVIQLGNTSVSDTVLVKNGKFKFSLQSVKSDKYMIKFINSGLYLPIVLDNGKLEVFASMDNIQYAEFKNIFVKGSKYKELLFEFEGLFEKLIKTYPKEDQDIYYNYIQEREGEMDMLVQREKITSLMKKYPTMPQDINKMRVDFMLANIDNFVLIDILNAAKWTLNPEDVERIYNQMPKYLQDSRYFKKTRDYLKNYKNLSKDKSVPLFTLQTYDGKKFSLSDLKGKYVLIDFWASWCSPCRAAIPHLKSLYKKFKDKNFEIVSVSIDGNKKAWEKACKKEKLPWISVIDDKSEKGKVAEKYNVDAIPKVVLLDPEGKLVFTQMGASGLDKKIEENLK